MRILVAGATGAVGRRLLPVLVADGHTVVGFTHTPQKVPLIRDLGAEPVVGDGLDPISVETAVASARPDVIVHEMTDLKGVSDLRHFDRTFAVSNRLRIDGTDNLLASARRARVKRFIAQSYCGWPYARGGDPVKSEADLLDPDPPHELRRSLDAIRHLEDAVTHSPSPEGVVLRYGTFYGPGTGLFEAGFLEQVRRHRVPIIGDGNGWWSFVHIDDAVEATALAVERAAPGIYNIVDDEPALAREWLPALAESIGARPPPHVPAWIARLLAGRHLVMMMTEQRAGSNAKAKRELAWHLRHPSWRRAFEEVAAQSLPYRAAA